MTRILLSALLVLPFLTGCDSKPSSGGLYSGDAHTVALLIEDMNDAKGNMKKARTLFAKDSFPAEFKKYYPLTFYAAGQPKVTGTEATAEVAIQTEGGADKGKQTWSFVKEGEAWKIKAAPLP